MGRIARAVQVFKNAAIAKLRLETEAAAARHAADDARAMTEAERAETARQQEGVVQALAGGLEQLAEGNLVHRIERAFPSEYEKLRTDYNGAMIKLQAAIEVVATNTAAIRSGAGEIATASDDLARRTEQQAASLEQTAAALDEITATVKKTSEGAVHARQLVSQAKDGAEHSGEVVQRAVAAMGAIETSAHKVSQIIGVIDEIAFQTNLLALNAGVEAARAGEAGRGFAVVASEVRGLAQRSAEAAKEIKALISASERQVEEGVQLVGETGTALKRIVVQVGDINKIVVDITTSTSEQATALQDVNTAVNQMDQVTQQNAAMVEQSTAASHGLTGEAEELAKLIARFSVGQQKASRAGPHPHASAASRTTMVTAAKRGGRSALAVASAVPVQESWEEF